MFFKIKTNSLLAVVTLGLAGSLVACSSDDSESAKADKNLSQKQVQEVVKKPQGKKSKDQTAPNLFELAAGNKDLSTLAALVKLCNLDSVLSDPAANFTVFAPTNAAFEGFLNGAPAPVACTDSVKNILLYHVVPAKVLSTDLGAQQAAPTALGAKHEVFVTKSAEGVRVNGSSKVILADALASNGVAHVVDTVLLPDAEGTVVDAALKRYDFSTLVSALVSANLVGTLSAANGITVFAPTNAAFGKLSAIPEGDALTSVLTSHVAPALIFASDIVPGLQAVNMLSGKSIEINASEGGVSIRGKGQVELGNIIAVDIATKNGVIHAIDTVLLPE